MESPAELWAGLLPPKLPQDGWTLPCAEDRKSGEVVDGDSIVRFKCGCAPSLAGEGEGGCVLVKVPICSRHCCPGPATFSGVGEPGCACLLPSTLAWRTQLECEA